MTALLVVQTVVIVLLGVLVVGLLRSHAEILRRLHALGAGEGDGHGGDGHGTAADQHGFRVQPGLATPNEGFADAADISGVTPWDEALGVSVVGAPHHTLVAFLSSGCQTCQTFWRAFADGVTADLPLGVRLVVVTHGPDEESVSATRDLAGATELPVVMATAAWNDYGVPSSPYFVLVDGPAGRVVGEGSASTWAQVSDLIGQAVADAPPPSGAALPLAAGRAGTSGQDRADRVDAELLAAGIHPGHPSLYGPTEEQE